MWLASEAQSSDLIHRELLISGIRDRHITLEDRSQWLASDIDNCSCCCELQGDQWPDEGEKWARSSRMRRFLRACGNRCICSIRCISRSIKKLVEHKYFQQGILVAILINTLSMGIEYHNQVSISLESYKRHISVSYIRYLCTLIAIGDTIGGRTNNHVS